MPLPEWLREEIARRTEEDRLARRAAYDEWARRYADSGAVFSDPDGADAA
jgi:hypothetical protein